MARTIGANLKIFVRDVAQITFLAAKAAVIRSYRRIRRASPFDIYEDETPKETVSQTDVYSEIMEFFKIPRTQSLVGGC